MTQDLVPLPGTGQAIDLANPVEVAQALDELAQLESQIRDAKRALVDALEPLAAELGTRTLHLGELEVTLTSPTKTEVDLEQLAELLTQAGLPDQRLAELIVPTVSYKLHRSVARQIRTNPAYAAALHQAETRVPATVYAKVTRR